VRDALAAVAQGQNGFAILDAAGQSIVGHIQLRHAAGQALSRGNVPSPGYAPAVRALDPVFPGTSMLAREMAVAFNQILSGALHSRTSPSLEWTHSQRWIGSLPIRRRSASATSMTPGARWLSRAQGSGTGV
jgi:hypothetical protein